MRGHTVLVVERIRGEQIVVVQRLRLDGCRLRAVLQPDLELGGRSSERFTANTASEPSAQRTATAFTPSTSP